MRLWPDFQLPDTESTSSAVDLARRAALLFAIVALHLLLILWLTSSPPLKQVAPPPVMSMFTVSLSSGHGALARPLRKTMALPPATRLPVLIIPAKLPIVDTSPSPTASASLGADTAAAGCALARDAGKAIGQERAAIAELDALPPDIRTSTDAVMLWNGSWLDLGAMPAGIERGALRRVVEGVAANAPPECRNAEAIGPQFIPIPERNRTVMIVVGSGTWHWADLIAPADCSLDGAEPCDTPGAAPTNGQ